MAGIDDLPDDVVAAAGRTAGAEAGAIGFFAQRAEQVARFEKQFLADLLARHLGDVSAAAREARLPRGTLYRLMKGHGLDGAQFRAAKEPVSRSEVANFAQRRSQFRGAKEPG
jgi:DNA-binding NtrC family response regulator